MASCILFLLTSLIEKTTYVLTFSLILIIWERQSAFIHILCFMEPYMLAVIASDISNNDECCLKAKLKTHLFIIFCMVPWTALYKFCDLVWLVFIVCCLPQHPGEEFGRGRRDWARDRGHSHWEWHRLWRFPTRGNISHIIGSIIPVHN